MKLLMRHFLATLLLVLPATITLGAEPTFTGPKLEIESYGCRTA